LGRSVFIFITASIAVRCAKDDNDNNDGSGVYFGRYHPIPSQRRTLHKTVMMTADRRLFASLVLIAKL
jgi:hypothetical protein